MRIAARDLFRTETPYPLVRLRAHTARTLGNGLLGVVPPA
jgi:hypothetical protein